MANITAWLENDPDQKKKYGREITVAATESNFFNPMMGKGPWSIIRTSSDFDGSTATAQMGLRVELEGTGVKGNADFDENTDNQKYLYQPVEYDEFGNSLQSQNKTLREKKHVDSFRESAQEDLKMWAGHRSEKIITAKLTQNCSNIVACKAGATPVHAQNDTTAMTAGDVFTLGAARHALKRSKQGFDGNNAIHPKLRPFVVKHKNIEGIPIKEEFRLMILGPYAAEQLKDDPEWVSKQESANNRGDSNPIFSGQMGHITDGILFLEWNSWDATEAGILTSATAGFEDYATGFDQYAGVGGIETELNLMLGAGSSFLPMDTGFEYHEEGYDFNRKMKIAISRGYAFEKARYYGKTALEQKSKYHNKDYGTMLVASTKL